MLSNRKIEANRRNSRKSCGPRTAAGKSIASRNALRHGLAAITYRQSVPSAEIAELARALCGDENNPALFAQAVKIAKNEMELRAIRAQQVDVVERLREPYVVPFAKKDNSVDLARARCMQAWLADREIGLRLPALLDKYKDQIPPPPKYKNERPRGLTTKQEKQVLAEVKRRRKSKKQKPPTQIKDIMRSEWIVVLRDWGVKDPLEIIEPPDWITTMGDTDIGIVPVRLKTLLEEPDSIDNKTLELARKRIKERSEERDDYEAMEAAILDLKRLERYQRRTWSRQKRAIRQFVKIKTANKNIHSTPAAEEHV